MSEINYVLLKQELNNFQNHENSLTYRKYEKDTTKYTDYNSFKTKVYCFVASLRGRRHLQAVRRATLLALKIPVEVESANIVEDHNESGNHLYEVTLEANMKLGQDVAYLFQKL